MEMRKKQFLVYQPVALVCKGGYKIYPCAAYFVEWNEEILLLKYVE